MRISGLDVGVARSDRRRRLGKLTKQGSPQLRWALCEAAARVHAAAFAECAGADIRWPAGVARRFLRYETHAQTANDEEATRETKRIEPQRRLHVPRARGAPAARAHVADVEPSRIDGSDYYWRLARARPADRLALTGQP